MTSLPFTGRIGEMKIVLVSIAGILLAAGCSSPPPPRVAYAEPPHIQKEDGLIAASNRFPSPGNRDDFYWLRPRTRNLRLGEGYEGITAGGNYSEGPQAPQTQYYPVPAPYWGW